MYCRQWAQERIVLNRHIDNLNAVLGGGFPQQQVQGMSIWEEEEDLAQKTGLTPQQVSYCGPPNSSPLSLNDLPRHGSALAVRDTCLRPQIRF